MIRISINFLKYFRKVDLITPEELELPWRPLYDLFIQVMPKPMQISFYHYHNNLKSLLESVICVAKCYFPVSLLYSFTHIVDSFKLNIMN